jgi:fibronectin-binding autotransporter adhesin
MMRPDPISQGQRRHPVSTKGQRQSRFRRLLLEPLEARHLLAVRIWDGDFGGNWGDAANWVGDVAPVAGDDLVFPASAANKSTTNDLTAGTRFNTIQIQGSGYDISGNAIELYGGLTANNTAGSNTFGLDVRLVNAQWFSSANPGTTLNLTGTIDTGELVGTTFIHGTSAVHFDGSGITIVTGTIAGSGSVTKLGDGTLVLANANTYQGITDVRQGVVRITHGSALGLPTTGDTQIQAGAALHVAGGITVFEPLAIREGGVGFGSGTDASSLGALRSVGGVNTWSGPIDLAGGNNMIGVDAGSTLEVAGVVSSRIGDGWRLLKAGAGTLRLSGAEPNVFRGETRVIQGTLELAKDAGVNAIGGNLIIGTDLGGDDDAVVRLLADDQLPDVDFFGVTLPTVEIRSSGRLELNGHRDTIGNLTLVTGVTASADVDLGGGTLTLGGNAVTVNAFQGSSGVTPAATISGGTLDLGTLFSGVGGSTWKTINVNDTQLNNIATDLIISANVTGLADVSVRKDGGGSLRLTGNNSGLASPFFMNGGIIELGSDTALGTGHLSLQNDGNFLTAYGGQRIVSSTVSLDGRINFFGDNHINFTAPATLSANREIRVMGAGQTVEFSAGIGEGIYGSLNITKRGLGTLLLTGPNTFSGALTISNEDSGPLRLAGNGTLPNINALTVGMGGELILDNTGVNLPDRINDATNIALGGKITFWGMPGAASSETLGNVNVDSDRSGTIESVVSGGGTAQLILRRLSASSTGATATLIGTGAPLSLNGANRISLIEALASNMTLVNGIIPAAVVLGPGGTLDFATVASSAAGFDLIPLPVSAYATSVAAAGPTSTVRLSASEALPVGKTINALLLEPGVSLTGADANLTITSGGVVFAGPGTSDISVGALSAGTTYRIFTQPGATGTINSRITGGALAKHGSGKLIFTGDNTYTSTTIISQGILNIQRSTALGSPAGQTSIREGAVLELEETTFGPVHVALEYLDWRGTGPDYLGSLRSVAGDNSWSGNIGTGGSILDLSGMLAGFPALTNQTVIVDVAAGSLNLSGALSGQEVIKRGPGTLEYSGVLANTNDAATRVLEGKLRLNKEAGVNAILNSIFVGSDAPGAPAAILELGASHQIRDDRVVTVHGSGLFDLNGNTEGFNQLQLVISSAGGAGVHVGDGGTLIFPRQDADNHTVILVMTSAAGHDRGATITGGELALNLHGQPFISAARSTRYFQVNDGAVGDDLTVTSAITDGSGMINMALFKNGFGTLVFGGTGANTYTGDTTVTEGELALAKPDGVNALSGRLFVGDGNVTNGFAGSDIVRLRANEQLPDWSSHIEIRGPGNLDLNGYDETIGTVDAENALRMLSGSQVTLGGGRLTINGNIQTSASDGVSLWTPVTPAMIQGPGQLDLGSVAPTINVADRNELPFDFIISADVVGAAGFLKLDGGILLLSGNNTYSGNTYVNNGGIAIATDQPFGTGVLTANQDRRFLAVGQPRSIPNEAFFNGRIYFGGDTVGGGGNTLSFTGPVQAHGGDLTAELLAAVTVEFAGGIGETQAARNFGKSGFGTVVLSGLSTFSGTATVNQNGGTVVLRDTGALPNANVTVNIGGVLEIDNATGASLSDRLRDQGTVTLSGGTLAFVGGHGAGSLETVGRVVLSDTTASTIQVLTSTSSGSSSELSIDNLFRNANAGGAVNFVGRGQELGAASPAKIVFLNPPVLDDGILPYAVLTGPSGLDFAGWVAVSDGYNVLNPLTSGPNFSTTLVGATATTNVKLSANAAIGAAIGVNALLITGDGVNVTGNATLTVHSGLLAALGAGQTVATTGLTLGGSESIVFVARQSDLNVSSNIAGATSTLAKVGEGLLAVSGAGTNTFSGQTRVAQGTYRAAKNTAFGSTAGNVEVQFGATVELAGGIMVPAEQITLRGNGEGTRGVVPLRNVNGVNTWEGNVVLNDNRTGIRVETGSQLILNGVVSNQGLNKLGGGTLEFGGTANNTFVQTSIVWEGTLVLNKTAGVNAVPSLNDNTEFFVGTYYGTDNSAVLRLSASNQIAEGPFRLRIMPSGLLDVNGFAETLHGRTGGGNNHDALGLDIGSISSGDVQLGGGTLRIVNTTAENGRIQVRVLGGGSPTPARIAGGTLELQGSSAVTRRILVDDSAALEDLVITATIANGGAVGTLQKDNNGRLVLAPTAVDGNTYTAPTIVAGGELVVRHSAALGSAAGATTVNSGASLIVEGVSSAEPLTLNGNGFRDQGALVTQNGNSTLSGTVALASASRVSVAEGSTLNLSGVISGGGGLFKLLPGTLQLSGSAPNTYTGTTVVGEGTLELNKAANVNALVGRVEVGNNAGMPGSDVLRWLANNQVADNPGTGGRELVVETTGLMDLNGFSEGIVAATSNSLFTRLGPTASGRIDLKGGTLTLGDGTSGRGHFGAGVLAITNQTIQVSMFSPPGRIEDSAGTGSIQLRTNNGAWDSGGDALLLREVEVSARIDNSLGGRITKAGAGLLALTADNSSTYLGAPINLNAGFLALADSNAAGNAASTIVVGGAANLLALPGGPALTLSKAITLNNNDLTLRGDADLTLTGAITNSGGNRILAIDTNAAAVVQINGNINLSNDGSARTLTINNNTFMHVAFVNGVVQDGTSTSGLTKGGSGIVVLTNNNTYKGATTVAGGVLAIAHPQALGTTAGATTVNNNAALVQAVNGLTVAEPLTLNGLGFNGQATGALRLLDPMGGAIAGTWTGDITLASAAAIGVDGAGSTLVLGGAGTISGGNSLAKIGAGTLEIGGTSANTYSGGTTVRQGTLRINSTAAVNEIQTVLLSAETLTGGTFTLSVGGTPTSTLAHNAPPPAAIPSKRRWKRWLVRGTFPSADRRLSTPLRSRARWPVPTWP